MKNNTKSMASLSLIAAVLMMTVSIFPFAYGEEETLDEVGNYIDDGTEEAIKWWMRVIPGSASIMGIYDYFNHTTGRLSVPAGSDNTVKAYARNIDAERSAEQQYNLLMVASDLVRNDTETWKLTDAYLNRAAEISAGSLWPNMESFDADEILRYGGVYNAIGIGNLNTQDVLDRAIKVSVDLRDEWDATNYGQQLEIKLKWNGGNTGNATSSLYADFCTLATVTSDNYIVYLSQPGDDYTLSENSTIWAYTNQGSIVSIDGDTSMPLMQGANDASALPSGFYKLSPGIYGGSFLQSVSANSAMTEGAMGIVCDDEYGYVTSYNTGVKIYWDGTVAESSTLDFEITGCDTPQTSQGSPFHLVRAYAEYLNQLTSLLYESAEAAQVMWTISAQANTSNILLSPSSIIPHLSNVNISPEQSYALYVLALDQIGQYNDTYGGVLKDGMTKISAQSLDLYCHGSIYAANGTVLAENVIFTPYVYLKDWSILSGQNNTFGQNGMVMIWDTADSAADWTMPTDATYESIVMQKGAYILPDEIYHKGEEVLSIHLDVKEIQRISVFEALDFDRLDAPKVLDASTLIMIIIIELGLIIVMLGYIIRIPNLMLIGLIVIVLGAFASKAIATLILGWL